MALGGLALVVALLLAVVAVWVLVVGFGDSGDGAKQFMGLVVLPLLALFVGGLGWLGLRHGREQLFYRSIYRNRGN